LRLQAQNPANAAATSAAAAAATAAAAARRKLQGWTPGGDDFTFVNDVIDVVNM
jgi:hypothetical protein